MPRSLASLLRLVRAAAGLPPAGSSSPAALLVAFLALLLAILRRVVAPSRCAACDEPTSAAGLTVTVAFCPPCARSIERAPSAGGPSEDLAYAEYGGAVAEAVRRLKYGPRPDLAHPLGELLRCAAR